MESLIIAVIGAAIAFAVHRWLQAQRDPDTSIMAAMMWLMTAAGTAVLLYTGAPDWWPWYALIGAVLGLAALLAIRWHDKEWLWLDALLAGAFWAPILIVVVAAGGFWAWQRAADLIARRRAGKVDPR